MAEEYINSFLGDNPENEADRVIAKLMRILELQNEIDRKASSAASNGGNTSLQAAVTAQSQLAMLTKQANASLIEQNNLHRQTIDLIAQENGHSKEFATVKAKLAVAMKQEAAAATEAARAETEASKQRLNNARAYAAELKNQESAKRRQIDAQKAAEQDWLQFQKRALKEASDAEKARQAESLQRNQAYVQQLTAMFGEAEATNQRGLSALSSRSTFYPYNQTSQTDPIAEGKAAVAQVQAQAFRDLDALQGRIASSAGLAGAATDKLSASEAKAGASAGISAAEFRAKYQILENGIVATREATVATEANAAAQKFFGDAYSTTKKNVDEGLISIQNSTKGLRGMFGILRQVAYILPGIGIAGIFNLAFEAIYKAWQGLQNYTGLVRVATIQERYLAETGEQVAQAYGKEEAKLELLRAKIEDVNTPMKVRLNAVKDIQAQFPTYFGNLTKEQILIGQVGDAYTKATSAILASARVRVYGDQLAKADESLVKLEDRIMRVDNISRQIAGVYKNDQGFFEYNDRLQFNEPGVNQYYPTGEKDKEGHDVFTSLRDDLKAYNNAMADHLTLLHDVSKAQAEAGFDVSKHDRPKGGRTPIPNDYYQQDISAQKKKLEEESKNRKADLEEAAAAAKAIADNENKSLSERLDAYKLYLKKKKALVIEEKDTAVAIAKQTISELQKEEKRNDSLISGGKVSDAQKTSLREKNDLIKTQIEGLNAEIIRLGKERNTEQAEIESNGAKDIERIRKSSIQEQIRTITEGLTDIANEVGDSYAQQKNDLENQLDDNLITHAEYKRKWADVDAKENNETLKRQKEFVKQTLNELLKQADVPPEVIRAVRKQFDQLLDKSLKPSSPETTPGRLGYTPQQEKYFQTYMQAAFDSEKVLSAFRSAASQKRIDAIDAEIDKIKERAEADVDAVKASAAYATMTEKQKNQKILEINNAARDKEKDLERERVAEMRRRAVYEKAVTIAEIIAKTALAVLLQLSSGDGYSAFARAILAGAAGAAQLATAIAAPIPQYKRGKQDTGKRGLAVVGDGGRQEVIETKDGNAYLTPAKSTLVDMPAHSKVYPSIDDYIARAHSHVFRGMGMMKRVDERSGLSTKEMERLLLRVANAAEALPKKPVVIQQDYWSKSYYERVKK